jgi:hypothetical protein
VIPLDASSSHLCIEEVEGGTFSPGRMEMEGTYRLAPSCALMRVCIMSPTANDLNVKISSQEFFSEY